MATATEPIGLIGGTGFERAFTGGGAEAEPVRTPYGEVTVWRLRLGGREARFWSRHGEAHALPPNRVPARAGLWALRLAGAVRVLATCAVGSLVPERLPAGSLAVVSDVMDFTRGTRPATFFDGPPLPVVHLEATALYCPDLRERLRRAGEAVGLGRLVDAVMVVTEGPRLETPAEIRAFGRLGAEVVGMTGMPEAALARELGMGYASVAVVTNAAAGLMGAIDGGEIDRLAKAAQAGVGRLFETVAAALDEGACPCCRPPAGAPAFPWQSAEGSA